MNISEFKNDFMPKISKFWCRTGSRMQSSVLKSFLNLITLWRVFWSPIRPLIILLWLFAVVTLKQKDSYLFLTSLRTRTLDHYCACQNTKILTSFKSSSECQNSHMCTVTVWPWSCLYVQGRSGLCCLNPCWEPQRSVSSKPCCRVPSDIKTDPKPYIRAVRSLTVRKLSCVIQSTQIIWERIV